MSAIFAFITISGSFSFFNPSQIANGQLYHKSEVQQLKFIFIPFLRHKSSSSSTSQQQQQQQQTQQQQQQQQGVELTPLTEPLTEQPAEDTTTTYDWTFDPNEPRYCLCNQVSYGEMVGCDNPKVSFFVCVWLTIF